MSWGFRATRIAGLALLAALCTMSPAAADDPGCPPTCAPPPPPSANLISSLTSHAGNTALGASSTSLDNHLNDMWFMPTLLTEALKIVQQITQMQMNLSLAEAKLTQLELQLRNNLALQEAQRIQLEAEKAALQQQIGATQSMIGSLQQMQSGASIAAGAIKGRPFAPTTDEMPANSPWRDPVIARALAYAGAQGIPDAPAAANPRSPWSAWTDTTYTGFDRDGPAATDGHTSVVTGGLDYRFSSQPLIVGVMAGYENQKFDTTFNGGYLRGSGPSVGPYASWQLLPPVVLNVAVGRAFLDYSMSDGTGVGNYNARRDYVSASLVGNWRDGPWRFTPRANIYYARENHDAYVNSAGAAVPGATVKLGRASVGPEIGYTVIAPGGAWAVEPFAFGALDCDTVNQPGIVAADGIVVTDSKCGGRAGGGLKAITAGNFTGQVGAPYNSIGRSDQSSWSLRAGAQLRF